MKIRQFLSDIAASAIRAGNGRKSKRDTAAAVQERPAAPTGVETAVMKIYDESKATINQNDPATEVPAEKKPAENPYLAEVKSTLASFWPVNYDSVITNIVTNRRGYKSEGNGFHKDENSYALLQAHLGNMEGRFNEADVIRAADADWKMLGVKVRNLKVMENELKKREYFLREGRNQCPREHVIHPINKYDFDLSKEGEYQKYGPYTSGPSWSNDAPIKDLRPRNLQNILDLNTDKLDRVLSYGLRD